MTTKFLFPALTIFLNIGSHYLSNISICMSDKMKMSRDNFLFHSIFALPHLPLLQFFHLSYFNSIHPGLRPKPQDYYLSYDSHPCLVHQGTVQSLPLIYIKILSISHSTFTRLTSLVLRTIISPLDDGTFQTFFLQYLFFIQKAE